MNVQEFKDTMTKDLFKMTIGEAIEKGICIQCKDPALPNCYSDAGIEEYKISGLCEKCFDEICGY